MNRRMMYRIHKWLAITVGVFVLAWFISGILMVMPTAWLVGLLQGGGGGQGAPRADSVSFKGIQISIPQAIAALESSLGREARVTEVKATRFGATLAYEFTLDDSRLYLVDAMRGTTITITQSTAEKMAQTVAPNSGPISATTLLSQRDYYYWGPLPVYKIAFGDSQRTVVYVAETTGQVQKMTRLGRFRRAVVSLHEFGPLRLLIESNVLRVGLLILFSVVGIGAVGAGFYIALPVRSRTPNAGTRP